MNVSIVLQSITAFLWIIVIGLIGLAIVRASRQLKVGGISTLILVTAILAVFLTSISAGLVFIQPEERGVVISAVASKGYREEPLEPGLRWIIPFLETAKIYPISRQTYTMSIAQNEGDLQGDDSISARTSDGQEVLVDASVIYAVDPAKVVLVHIEWQDRYSKELVRPVARGVIRDAISQYGVEEVYSSQREMMTQLIKENMSTKLSDNGLVLIDFVLRNITFSPEYAASVEQKQIAEQTAQQAKFVVEQRKQEAEQARQVAEGQADAAVIKAQGEADARLIQAEAEAKALQTIAQSVANSPDLLSYLYITKINPNIQVMMVPENIPYLLTFPELGPPNPTLEDSSGLIPSLQPTPTPTPTPVP